MLVAITLCGTVKAASAGSPPQNDSFAAATGMSGEAGRVDGTNRDATREAGEPVHDPAATGASVWFRWAAPRSGPVTLDLSISSFDAVAAVYVGSSVSTLTRVPSTEGKRVRFEAVAGTAYAIAVDGRSGQTGSFSIIWGAPPANDHFAEAGAIAGPLGSVRGTTRLASREAAEPQHAGVLGASSIWYRWRAPTSGRVVFDLQWNYVDWDNKLLAVYTGGSVASLTEVAGSAASGPPTHDRVAFNANEGETYAIAVDGAGGAYGEYQLNWGPPLNDDFAAAEALAASGSASGSTLASGAEPGEPGELWGRTIWYRWNAPADGQATFDTAGSDFNTVLEVWTGASLADLALVTRNDDNGDATTSRITFPAAAGVEYRIRVLGARIGAYDTQYAGHVALAWTFTAGAPPSDTTPPSASLQPLYSLVHSTVTLEARASDDTAVQRVDFIVDGAVIGSDDTEPYTAPWDSRSHPDGEAVLEARAADRAGNIGLSPPVRVVVDNTPPQTTIVSGPPDVTSSTSAAFVFAAPGEEAASPQYEVSLDGGPWYAPDMGTHYTATGLADGPHVLLARAVDQAFNPDPTPARWEWRVDASARPAHDDLANASYIGSESGTTSDRTTNATSELGEPVHALRGSGHSVWYRWRIAGGVVSLDTAGSSFDTVLAVYTGESVNALTLVASNDNDGADVTSRLTFNADGKAPYYYVAVDGATGATGSFVLNWFGFYPDTEITEYPGSIVPSSVATFQFKKKESGGSGLRTFASVASEPFECSIDAAAWQACASPKTYSGLAAGQHRFDVRALDASGHADPTPASRTWTVQNGAPPPSNLLTNGSFESGLAGWGGWHSTLTTVGSAGDGAVAAKVSLAPGYTGGFSIFTAPRPVTNTAAGTSYAASASVRSDTPGMSVCLTIREWDAAGNAVGQSPTCSASTTSWARYGPVKYTAQQSGGSVEVYVYTSGASSFEVDAVSLEQTTPRDLTPPETTIDSGPSGSVADTSATFSFSANEPATFECALDGGAWSKCASPTTYGSLAAAQHTFLVRATDAAANIDATPASRTWTATARRAGSLDPSFSGGISSVTPDPLGAYARHVALQADGKILIAGETVRRPAPDWNSFAVSRLNPDGTVDQSFGSGGFVTTRLGDGDVDLRGMALQPDGRIVVCGDARKNEKLVLALARYLPNGSVDPSFGANGVVVTDLPGYTGLAGCGPVVLSDGRILVAAGAGRLADDRFGFVARLVPNGSLDANFGSRGWVEFRKPGADLTPSGLAVQPDGRIVVGGDAWAMRLTSSGAIDPSFGNEGFAGGLPDCCWSTAGIQLAPGGDILLTGNPSGHSHMWVLRLTRDGARATGFGNNGLVVVPGLSDGDSVAIQEDGKILASGIAYNETTNGYDFDLVRLLPDGDFDSSFGVGGHARHSLKVGSGVREASTSDVTIQPDGRAVAVVTSRGSAPVPQVALRFLSDRDATGERIPPDTAIDSGPEATATTREATFTFSSSEPGTFRCQMDDWGWGACTSPKSYPGMAEGPHTFRVRAVDLEGNTDLTPATHTWTIKLPPPPSANLLANGSFETGLNGWVGWHATLAAAGGAAEGTGAAKVSLGSGYTGGFSIYPSPRPVRTTIAGTTYAGGGAVRSDAAGVKVCLYIREWDGSGVVVAQSASCLTSSTSWQRFPSITYTTLQSGGSLELYAYASGGGTSFDVDALTLTQGTGTPADTAPPDTTIIAGPSGTTGEAGASFSFDATEPSTFECTLDGSAWTSCSSPKQYSGLAPGQHTFRARATDTAGNTDASPATRTWTIQAAPPPPSTNLLVNGGFEDGTSGWTGWHAALSTLTPGAEGAGAAQVTLAAGYTGGFSLYPSPRPVRTTIAGTAYTARGQMRSDTAGKPICLYIREWSAAGAVVAQASSCVTSTTAWQLIPTVRYTTGESGGSLEIYVYGSGLTSFAVDGLVLAPA